MAGLCGKVEREVEIKAPAEKFYKVWKSECFLLPPASPSNILRFMKVPGRPAAPSESGSTPSKGNPGFSRRKLRQTTSIWQSLSMALKEISTTLSSGNPSSKLHRSSGGSDGIATVSMCRDVASHIMKA